MTMYLLIGFSDHKGFKLFVLQVNNKPCTEILYLVILTFLEIRFPTVKNIRKFVSHVTLFYHILNVGF